jgi:RpiR family carbohydrate utilization transcriptional regulator
MTAQDLPDVQVEPQGVLARVRASRAALSEAERRVADAVTESPEDAVRIPVRLLAQRIGVGEATIIRFCRSLGFGGLRDFKLALAAETLAPHRIIHDAISPRDDLREIVTKVFGSDMQALADTLAILDAEAFARAVDALLPATRIEFYAIGSSVPVALDAHYRLLRIGLPVTVATDPHMQALSASQLPPGAVAFAISHIGRSAEVRLALVKARGAGATTILLTSHAHTPLNEYADIELITASPSSTLRPEAVASRIAHLALIDALSVALATRRPNQAREWLVRDDAIIAEREITE